MPTAKQAAVIAGDRSVLRMAHWAMARLCVEGMTKLTVLDCGGVFNPYVLVRAARWGGLKPQEVLSRVWVCRTFTGYQEVSALRRFAKTASGQRLYVLNPLEVLLDPDLPGADRLWLLNRVLVGLSYLSAHDHLVRIWQPQPVADSGLEQAFYRALTARFPTMVARDGQLLKVQDGQERRSLLPRRGRDRVGVPPVPTRAA